MKKLSVILSFLLLFVLFSECTKDKNDTKPTPMVSV
ncbi:MAG: hypothetical protein JWQ38_1678, partial [Flavipsychrobacter sp.]|nr:hypothetical protein [Flavipsychrobacter sp.]